MKFLFSVLLCFLIFTTQAQQINIEICNEASNIAARNSCIKGAIESLLFNKLKKVASNSQTSQDVQAELYLDAIGNFYLDTLVSSNPQMTIIMEETIQGIKPLSSYKNTSGQMLEDIISLSLKVDPVMNDFSKEDELGSDLETQEAETKKEEKENIAFAVIENVPVFPGCYADSNQELKACMSLNIQKHVVNNFNLSLANSLNLPSGKQRIAVQFKIDKFGFIVNVRARAEHPALEEEAIRVVQSLPRMIPGKQRGKEVGVLYALPIIFHVEGETPQNEKQAKKRKKRT
ncbi:energy transducer TonB [Aureisphaera sp. CAU 1614]|mgnify:CR=1 FL=1|uniref:Energy transducer TonB n=1 Tax=Halomarinibacterium sedimenti TaxID=2857106 RepID=A0A9X1JWF5_9FLAO|nr:energy transducer TonB [Halomarinibacterium sedimenti]MAL59383.1 hypothetical protein [Flavobacteriaceae bacterium]MBW2939079.1 energy transducer TonB [Halomarinibacterium sedimenti]HAT63588.1 hypothetical protein [Flavobacteriaceae bacterium]|tara:strand:- start:37882 stop:38748 length:867 start_codon:yes stop_codon:yes gene_type:complete